MVRVAAVLAGSPSNEPLGIAHQAVAEGDRVPANGDVGDKMDPRHTALNGEHPMPSIQAPQFEMATVAAGSSILSRKQVANLVLASLGSLLEWYEFMVFGFFTVVIARLFFPPDMPESVRVLQTFAIFSIGYVLRPISGALVGHLGDRYGRKKLFLATVLAMALSTLAIGLLPTYAQIGVAAPIALLALRIIQGIAIAGEFAGAAVFVFEHVKRDRVGSAIGPMMAGLYSGWFLGALVGTLLVTLLDQASLDSWGWRLAFIGGGLFGLLAVYLRRFLDETPMYKEIAKETALRPRIPVVMLVRTYWRRVLIVALGGTYAGSMILALYFYTPALLQSQYHVPAKMASNAIPLALLLLAAACIVWGRIADRIGPASVLGIGAVGLAVSTTVFYLNIAMIAADSASLIGAFLVFTVFLGTVVAMPMIGTMIFPTEVRFSGFGLSYNIGSVLAAFTPSILAFLVLRTGSVSVPYFICCDTVIGLVAGICAARALASEPRRASADPANSLRRAA